MPKRNYDPVKIAEYIYVIEQRLYDLTRILPETRFIYRQLYGIEQRLEKIRKQCNR